MKFAFNTYCGAQLCITIDMGLLFSRRHIIEYIDLDNDGRDKLLKVMKECVESHYRKSNRDGYTIFIKDRVDLSTNTTVTSIPSNLWYYLINKATQKPFIKKETLYEMGTEVKISFIINPNKESPSPLLARSAVIVGLKRADICPITYDSLADIDKYCVNICGHVFSDAAESLEKCPLCNMATSWASVYRKEILDL
jgi:hypothetical protein